MRKPLLLTAAMLCWIIPTSFAQTTKRTVTSPVTNFPVSDRIQKNGSLIPTDMRAITIVSMIAGGKKVLPGESFDAPTDWLKDLRLEVKNISGRPIKKLNIGFVLPETRTADRSMGFSLGYANGPIIKTASTGNAPELPLIKPGNVVTLYRTEAEYLNSTQLIQQRSGLSDFSGATFTTATVVFDDGTVWISQRLPFVGLESPPLDLGAYKNLLNGVNWTANGETSIEQAKDRAVYAVRNKGSFSQNTELPANSGGKFVLFIGRCSSERVDPKGITGLPYLYGFLTTRDAGGHEASQPLQGHSMSCDPGETDRWATNWGIFQLPSNSVTVRVDMNQAERLGLPQNGSAARFADVGMYLFKSESEAREFVLAYDDLYRPKGF